MLRRNGIILFHGSVDAESNAVHATTISLLLSICAEEVSALSQVERPHLSDPIIVAPARSLHLGKGKGKEYMLIFGMHGRKSFRRVSTLGT